MAAQKTPRGRRSLMGPLNRAAEEYLGRDMARFHMPGHKGQALPGLGWGEIAPYDLTECLGMDSLFHADGPIRKTERAYSRLYGTADSLLSAGGSTLCIQAMLALALRPGDKLLVGRGVHRAAVNAMALLDLHPTWLLPPLEEETGLAGAFTPAQIRAALEANPGVKALYITSPTYFGILSDIGAISDICREKSIPLLVDNAHGAHLAFLRKSLHPIAHGADLCCDSLHKTLPVLTGGAMLHLGNPAYGEEAREKLGLFGSTSPSYLVMLSADAALEYLEGPCREELAIATRTLEELAAAAREKGFLLPQSPLTDPLRIALGGAGLGYDGFALGEWLRSCGVEPELMAQGFCVLMASGRNSKEDFARLADALGKLPAKEPLPTVQVPALSLPEQVIPLREAVFAPALELPLEQAVGRVVSTLAAPCPPGIALAAPGERLDSQTAALLKSYGISTVNVVK